MKRKAKNKSLRCARSSETTGLAEFNQVTF